MSHLLLRMLIYLRYALDGRAAPHLRIAREALGFDASSDFTLDVQIRADITRAPGRPREPGVVAAELRLPREQWPIPVELAALYEAEGERAKARLQLRSVAGHNRKRE